SGVAATCINAATRLSEAAPASGSERRSYDMRRLVRLAAAPHPHAARRDARARRKQQRAWFGDGDDRAGGNVAHAAAAERWIALHAVLEGEIPVLAGAEDGRVERV